jgi:hypothetical protein
VDFLRGFQLLVDVVGGHLIPRSTVTAGGGGEIFAVLQHVVQQQLATTAPAVAQQQLATPAPTVALQQLATPAPAIAQQQLAAPAISSATAGSTVAPLKAVGSSRSKSYAEVVKDGASTGPQLEAAAAAVTAKEEWHRLVADFPGVTQSFTVASSPTHGVQHHIETSGGQ